MLSKHECLGNLSERNRQPKKEIQDLAREPSQVFHLWSGSHGDISNGDVFPGHGPLSTLLPIPNFISTNTEHLFSGMCKKGAPTATEHFLWGSISYWDSSQPYDLFPSSNLGDLSATGKNESYFLSRGHLVGSNPDEHLYLFYAFSPCCWLYKLWIPALQSYGAMWKILRDTDVFGHAEVT